MGDGAHEPWVEYLDIWDVVMQVALGRDPANVHAVLNAWRDLAAELHQEEGHRSASQMWRAESFHVHAELRVAEYLLRTEIPAPMAWNDATTDLLRKVVPLQLPLEPGDDESLALAATMLRFDGFGRESMLGPGSLCATVAALCEFQQGSRARQRVLHGQAGFADFSRDDIQLAASYRQASANKSDDTGLTRLLAQPPERWSAARHTFASTRDSDKQFATFRGMGAQPRLAEVLFGEHVEHIIGQVPSTAEDLNLLWRKNGAKGEMPAQDWRVDGVEYDVKSNVSFRSHMKKNGLRGFYLQTAHPDPAAKLAAFVLVALPAVRSRSGKEKIGAGERVGWSFIGMAGEPEVQGIHGRVAPFVFDLPPHLHFPFPAPTVVDRLRRLLKAHPSTASEREEVLQMEAQEEPFDSKPTKLVPLRPGDIGPLVRALELAKSNEIPGRGLHQQLWIELTEKATEALRTPGARSGVRSDLAREVGLLDARWAIHPLPRVGRDLLLRRWVEAVLDPLLEGAGAFRCPSCGAEGTTAVELAGGEQTAKASPGHGLLSAAGTLRGALTCEACGTGVAKASLLAHCHDCQRYPLLLGHQDLCPTCSHLICDWPDFKQPQELCGACGCARRDSARRRS